MGFGIPRSASLVLLLIPLTAPAEEPRVDHFGDALPPGAIARLGTVRWRHGDGASFVSFLPGGKEVLSVGRDDFVRFWDAATGKEVRQFRIGPENRGGNPVAAAGAALSNDGKVLAVSTPANQVRVYETASGKELWNINAQDGWGLSIAPDGKTLAVQERSGTIRLIDVATGKPIRKLAENVIEDRAYRISARGYPAFSPDGKVLVSAAPMRSARMAGGLIMWNVATGKEIRRIEGNNRFAAGAAAFSHDGKLLAWANGNGSIVVADASNGAELRQLARTAGPFIPGALVFAPDDKTIAALDVMGRNAVIWNATTGKEERAFTSQLPRRAVSVALPGLGTASFSPDGKRLVVGSPRSAIRMLNVETGEEDSHSGHQTPIVQIGYNADGKTVASADANGLAIAWDPAHAKEVGRVKPEQDHQGVFLSPDARFLMTHTGRGQLALHDFASGKRTVLSLQQSFPFTSVPAVSPAGRLIAASVSNDSAVDIVLFDAATGKERSRFALPFNAEVDDGRFGLPARRVHSMQFSPDGRQLAAHYDFERIMVWNLAAGREQCRISLPQRASGVTFAFSRDGKTLAVDNGGDTPGLWETTTGKERRAARGRAVPQPQDARLARLRVAPSRLGVPISMHTVAISADGRLLAHAPFGDVVHLWHLGTDKELGQLKGHRAEVTALSFASDGNTLASGSADTTVLLWDVKQFAASAKSRTAKLDPDARWTDLIGEDASRAFDALHEFAAAPKQAVEHIEKNLRVESVDTDSIQRLIADLDSEQFTVRKKASVELERMGQPALALLRQALENDPTPEARKRIEELLKKGDQVTPRGETLRSLRAIEVLETIATSEAKRVLQKLAKGTPGAVVTEAAEEALDRLGR
jgi:WD40 repeat protein